MVVNSSLLADFLNEAGGQVVRNIIFGCLNAEDVGNAFLFEEFDVFGSFKIRAHRYFLSDVWNSELIERVFVINLNASIGVTGSDSIGTVVGLLVDVNSAGVPFGFDLIPPPHKQVLETFAPFIHVKCKRINSLILRKAFELLSEFLVLSECFKRIVESNSFHSIVYLPSAQFADVSHHEVFFIVLGCFNTQVQSHFFLVPLVIWV